MATINFLYRSIKNSAPLKIRLLHTTENGKPLQLEERLQLNVTKKYWQDSHFKLRIKDIETKNQQIEIRQELDKVESFVLSKFNLEALGNISNDWFKDVIKKYYNPVSHGKTTLPLDLIGYAEHYLKKKSSTWGNNTIRPHKSTVNKLRKIQNELGEIIKVTGVNEAFKWEYVDYCERNGYSPNTMQREIGRIKEYCRDAKKNGLETYGGLEDLTITGVETNHVYLNFEELEIIKNLPLKNLRLINARDLLLVACYSGQRVSDFMRFNISMIREEDDARWLEFQQVKPPKKWMSVPLTKDMGTFLQERGQFPKGISEQKFNDYVKEVCEIAGLTEMVKGSKIINIAPEGQKSVMRVKNGLYKKSELISSHIGRRSFATNYYGTVPTSYLMFVTGHSRETTFLIYIKKPKTDLVKEAYRLLQ
jgi:integrase